MTYLTISMRELEQWISSARPMLLVDLRTEEEYSRGHLRGAVNLPFDQLEWRADELPEGVPIVFYCLRGSKSILACNRLYRTGLQVVNTGGGLLAYRGKYMVRS